MFFLCNYAKLVDAGLGVDFSGDKLDGWEVRLIRTVGIVLGFKTEAVAVAINLPALSRHFSKLLPEMLLSPGFHALNNREKRLAFRG